MSIIVHRHGILGGGIAAVASNITITETVVDFGSAAAALYELKNLGTDVFKIQLSAHNLAYSATQIRWQVSTDNGVSYDGAAGNYNRAQLNEAQDIGDSLAFGINQRGNANEGSFLSEIFGTAIASSTIFDAAHHESGANAAGVAICFRTTEQVEDALKFYTSTAGNITDGMFVIEVWTLN